jgi:nitrogen regulatory protein P-II 1
MHLLVVILHKEEFLDDVLSGLVEMGIIGATVIESTRMSEILVHDIPIFAGLRQMKRGGRTFNRVIIAPIEKREVTGEVLKVLKELNIDFSDSETGVLFTIPIEDFSGNLEDLEL